MKPRFYLEAFTDKAKQARFRMKAKNGKIILSSEAYSSPAKANQTMHAVAMELGIPVKLAT